MGIPKKRKCPCGSGKRYMACCRGEDLSRRSMMKAMQSKMLEVEQEMARYKAKYGHINRPSGAVLDGKTWVLVGGHIYQTEEAGPYNVANAVHDHALHFFGNEFLDEQDERRQEDRHPAINWLNEMIEARALHGKSHQDGNGAAWHRLAYDIYTIRDNSRLQKELVKRLLDPKTFQAARYELKVAAICAAAGFDLHYENESDNTKKHPEFVGENRFTGARIAVEAKSRHRKGVLGFTGGHGSTTGGALNVRKNVVDAYGKKGELPLYVFIDVNAPPADDEMMACWEEELAQLMDDLANEGYENPCPANAVFFTNDPSHYVGRGPIGRREDMLWVRAFHPINPATPADDAIAEGLLLAHSQRVASPEEFG